MQYVYADCVNTCTVKQKTISLLARDGTSVNNFSSSSEATTYTYMSGDKVLYKDYIVRNNICICTNNLTGNSSTWYCIELYNESNQIKSMSQTIWLIYLEQSLHFRVPLLDDLHCVFKNLALIFLLGHLSHSTGLGNGVVNNTLLILPKFNMVSRK